VALVSCLRSSKVPPGDAGHPVCLDTSTNIHLALFTFANIVLRHNPGRSPTLSVSDKLFVKRLVAQSVFPSTKSMLLSVHNPIFSAAYSRHNA
jgi:hypothetical protein